MKRNEVCYTVDFNERQDQYMVSRHEDEYDRRQIKDGTRIFRSFWSANDYANEMNYQRKNKEVKK